LLPDPLVSYSTVGQLVVPRFLGEHDHPWLRVLLEEHERFVGRPRRELDAQLHVAPHSGVSPTKWKQAIHVLATLARGRHRQAAVPSRQARRCVFVEAARTAAPPSAVLNAVATALGVTAQALEDSLFADLPGERLVAPPSQPLSAAELALRANLALVQALLGRAESVRIEAEGQARALVRHAKLHGLICAVAQRAAGGDAVLELSGPFALFRHTRIYGRALGELVPFLAWCRRFRLRAACFLEGRRFTLELGPGDPIFPGGAPRHYDSRIEERFARDFRRLAPEWDAVREPEPVVAGGTLIFPDFALQHRADTARRWLLEIVGFWTPDYVARKLALYRQARLTNLILCIDEDRNCARADLPPGALVVRFHRRVDAAVILRLLAWPPGPEGPRISR
jgi:predicted nuclease of restriction endonuclease-like RecB superfamily